MWNELEPREQQRWNEVLQARAAGVLSDLAKMLIDAGIGEQGKLDAEGATVVSWALVTVGLAGILCLTPDEQQGRLKGSLLGHLEKQMDALDGVGLEIRERQARSRS